VYGRLTLIVVLMAWLALAAEPPVALADGGALRFSERRDGRIVTVFTTPTPLRAGLVDVSALVQDSDSGRPLRNVSIVVHAFPIHHAAARVSAAATTEAATNKLLRAARLELSKPGRWHVEVIVSGTSQGQPIGFDVEVAEAFPPWLQMSLWIGWPLVAIGLFAVHQFRIRRRLARESRVGSRRIVNEAAVEAQIGQPAHHQSQVPELHGIGTGANGQPAPVRTEGHPVDEQRAAGL
jgi:hypothetical protein